MAKRAARTYQLPASQREAFHALIDSSAGEDACWPWLGARYWSGRSGELTYGDCGIGGAHIVAYVEHYKQQPLGKVVCHSCDNPICCNPAHLWLGTQKQNLEDMTKKGRRIIVTGTSNRNFTDEEIRLIRASPKAGPYKVRDKVLASKYGVSPLAISKIRNFHSYKHVI